MASTIWLRPAPLPLKLSPFGIISDSWSHCAAFAPPFVPAVIVLSVALDVVPGAVLSETVMLIPLTPEKAEWVSQALAGSLGEVGEMSMLISAVPKSFCALLVMGADMDRFSSCCCCCCFCFCRRCGRGNLSLDEAPILSESRHQVPKIRSASRTAANLFSLSLSLSYIALGGQASSALSILGAV